MIGGAVDFSIILLEVMPLRDPPLHICLCLTLGNRNLVGSGLWHVFSLKQRPILTQSIDLFSNKQNVSDAGGCYTNRFLISREPSFDDSIPMAAQRCGHKSFFRI